jgi:hypothetical protein
MKASSPLVVLLGGPLSGATMPDGQESWLYSSGLEEDGNSGPS